MKIDVQGYELEVLKGAKKLLKKIDYIIAEVSYQKIYTNQISHKKLIHFLNKNNFFQVKKTNVTNYKKKLFQSDILFKRIKK